MLRLAVNKTKQHKTEGTCFLRYLPHAVRLLRGKFYVQSADWLVNCGTRKPEINISLSVAVASVSIYMLGSLCADVSYFFLHVPFPRARKEIGDV